MIYINSADNQYYNKDKMVFEKNIENNLYQIVIKTTKNKKENYILSFYKANHKKKIVWFVRTPAPLCHQLAR